MLNSEDTSKITTGGRGRTIPVLTRLLFGSLRFRWMPRVVPRMLGIVTLSSV